MKLLNYLRSKLKKHSSWIKDYLVEISIVVISIAITFYGDSLIEKYNDKQEDREMMEMVKLELEANMNELTKMVDFYHKEYNMGTDLSSYLAGGKITPADSLEKHFDQHRSFIYWFLKNNAFDILRVSGTMQRTDKDLLMSLLESYEQLGVVKNLDERYMLQKSNHILNFRYTLQDGEYGETTIEQWEQIRKNEDYKRFLCNNMPLLSISIIQPCERGLNIMNSTMDKIRNKYE